MTFNNTADVKHHAEPSISLFFLLILSALMAFTSLSTDIYLPAMPVMSHDLQGNVELTLTGFLIGFAIAQLIWGPISDRFGRRLPLFIGMLIFTFGSIGCALSQSIEQIVFWRVIQALGACIGPMLARAMVRDLFTSIHAVQILSTLTIIMAIAPIIGPLLGGQLLRISSWHAIFWLLSVISLVMFMALFWLPETLPQSKRNDISLGKAFNNYLGLLQTPAFMSYALCVTFFYVSAYAFIAGSPFVYINYFGVSSQHYGWLFAVNILGVMGLSLVNRQLVRKIRLDTLLRGATTVAMLATLLLMLLVLSGHAGLVSVVVLVFLFFSMNGIVAASSTASALIGSLQYGSGIISSLLLARFSDDTPLTMSWIMALFTFSSAAMAWWAASRRAT